MCSMSITILTHFYFRIDHHLHHTSSCLQALPRLKMESGRGGTNRATGVMLQEAVGRSGTAESSHISIGGGRV